MPEPPKKSRPLQRHTQVPIALEWMLDDIEGDFLATYQRTMIDPLIDAVRKARATGDDKRDLRRLRDSLPAVFDEMKGDAFEAVATAALTQASLIGEAVALPASLPVTALTDEEAPAVPAG